MRIDPKLGKYQGKRDFSKTPEPKGGTAKVSHGPIFVIQQHDASHLHYDFRLEADGVLVSFAIPKGPSTDPKDKRLAVRTEDHPLEYAAFEGIIPEGEYGAGTVIVWDGGEYENVSEKNGKALSMSEAIKSGHIRVRLHGNKLSGGYSLIHAKLRGEDKNWLLVKEADEAADPQGNPVADQPRSIISGLTIQELTAKAHS